MLTVNSLVLMAAPWWFTSSFFCTVMYCTCRCEVVVPYTRLVILVIGNISVDRLSGYCSHQSLTNDLDPALGRLHECTVLSMAAV